MCSAEKWGLEGIDSDSACKNHLLSVPWCVLSCPGGKKKSLLSLRRRTEGDILEVVIVGFAPLGTSYVPKDRWEKGAACRSQNLHY